MRLLWRAAWPYLRGETGATAAEYALILAILGATIAASCYALGLSITDAVTRLTACMTTHTSC